MGHNSCQGRLHPDQAGPTNTCRRVGIQRQRLSTNSKQKTANRFPLQAKLFPSYQDIILVILPQFKNKRLNKYHLVLITLYLNGLFLFLRILIRTGNPDHKDDVLVNGSLLVLPLESSRPVPTLQDSAFTVTSSGFLVVASFKDGLAHVQFSENMEKISRVKVVVEADNENWMIVSEVRIFYREQSELSGQNLLNKNELKLWRILHFRQEFFFV